MGQVNETTMKMKFSWKIGALIGLVAIFSIASIGITYAANGSTASLCAFSWTYSNDDGSTGKPSEFPAGIDPDDNGRDPQSAQAPGVASTRNSSNIASTTSNYTADSLSFNLHNAYPGYCPTIFFGLSNQWSAPGRVQSIDIQNPSPALLNVNLNGISRDQIIVPGQEITGALSIEVGNIPQNTQSAGYTLVLTLIVSQLTQPDMNPGAVPPSSGISPSPVLALPSGSTAELDTPPSGSTAGLDNPSSNSTAGLDNPSGGSTAGLDIPTPSSNPLVTPLLPAVTPTPASNLLVAQPLPATPPADSLDWQLIISLVAVALVITWLVISLFRRKKRKKEGGYPADILKPVK
jgi:hypothetical protein